MNIKSRKPFTQKHENPNYYTINTIARDKHLISMNWDRRGCFSVYFWGGEEHFHKDWVCLMLSGVFFC